MTEFQVVSSIFAKDLSRRNPALLTRISIRPYVSIAAWITALPSSTDAVFPVTDPPSFCISWMVESTFEISFTMSVAPLLAKNNAYALPSLKLLAGNSKILFRIKSRIYPLPAPVIRITLPSKRIYSGICNLSRL